MKWLLLLTVPALLGAVQVYQIRPAAGTHFNLEVRKTGLLAGKKHIFSFERYHGTVEFDAAMPTNSRVELTIEAASAVCKDTWVSPNNREKIQSTALNEMMDARNHPELRFTSTRVTPLGDNQFDVAGMLEIRGIAKPVTVKVTVKEQSPDVLAVSGAAEIRLKDYGLKPPSAAMGTIGTKNEMLVDFAIVAGRAK